MKKLFSNYCIKTKRKNKSTNFAKNIISLFIAHVFIKLIGFVNKIYLTNKQGFGDEGNAIYSSAFQIYALFLTISSMGIPNAVSKLVSERLALGDTKGAHKVFKIALVTFGIIGFICSISLYLFAEYISCTLIQIPEAKLSIEALSPAIFFVSITSVIKGYFNGRENLSVGASSQTVEQLFRTIVTIVLVEYIATTTGLNTKIMAGAAAISSTISEIICFIYLYRYYAMMKKEIGSEIRRSINYKYQGRRKILKNIFTVSIPMSIGPVIGGINKNVDSVTIVRGLKQFITETEAKIQYGILTGKVDTIIAFPLSFNNIFSSILIPTVSSAKASGNFIKANRKIEFSILMSILIGMPATVGIIFFAKPILELLFPNQPAGAILLQISAISIVFTMINQNVTAVLHGLGKTIITIFVLIIGVAVKVILNTILLNLDPSQFAFGGINGAALANTISCIVICLIEIKIMKKHIDIKLNVKKIIKPIIATIIMMISLIFIYNILLSILSKKMSIIVSILISVMIYCIVLIVIKTFSREEIKMLPFGENIYKILNFLKIYR